MKRILRSMPTAEVLRRIDRFIKSDDPFYVRGRHQWEIFVHAVNVLTAREVEAEDNGLSSAASETQRILETLRESNTRP